MDAQAACIRPTLQEEQPGLMLDSLFGACRPFPGPKRLPWREKRQIRESHTKLSIGCTIFRPFFIHDFPQSFRENRRISKFSTIFALEKPPNREFSTHMSLQFQALEFSPGNKRAYTLRDPTLALPSVHILKTLEIDTTLCMRCWLSTCLGQREHPQRTQQHIPKRFVVRSSPDRCGSWPRTRRWPTCSAPHTAAPAQPHLWT